MDLTKEEKQRKEFCDILFKLSKSQNEFQDAYARSTMYMRLEQLYDSPTEQNRFRHFYSDIFSVLTQIKRDPSLGDINVLGQNIKIIRNGYKPQNPSKDGNRIIDISNSINKLYDHVNLDIARIAYLEGADNEISGESAIKNINSQLTTLENDIKKAQQIKEDYDKTEKKIIDVEQKINSAQKEYITILGIFASIVLAFTGGIAFSTSVLNNIAQASIYRTIIISLIIGLVLINILFGLFFYINKLVGKEGKIQPLIISNAVILVLILVTVLIWHFGWVEARNERIETAGSSSMYCQTIIRYLKSVL